MRASSADQITHDESDQSGTIPAVPTQLTELPMWQSARPIETVKALRERANTDEDWGAACRFFQSRL